MKKKAVSVICAFVMGACCLPLNTQAKVIEPEIVKTEEWTTSYIIDDDVDTLYPYVQCKADIYNDGTIKLYMWNTHEWDGFTTVKHKVSLYATVPYSTNSEVYSAKYNVTVDSMIGEATFTTSDIDMHQIDVSYYPKEYSGPSFGQKYLSYKNISFESSTGWGIQSYIEWNKWEGALPNLKVGQVPVSSGYASTISGNCYWTFSPKVDPTETYKFRLFGHDITITPELLSENIVATPQLTEQEKYIQQLEAENAALKAENEKLKSQISILSTAKFCDVNQDGIVGVEDAQLVLIYYTETIAELVKDEPIEDWYAKRNTI